MSQTWDTGTIDPATTSPATDITKIVNALDALKSKFSGAALPTANLVAGMEVTLNDGTRWKRNAANNGWDSIDLPKTVTTAGTAPNFTLTPTPAPSAYAAGQRFRVKFNANGTTGSNTLNVAGLGSVAIKQYDATGAKVGGVVKSGMLADVEHDGANFVILDALPPVIPPASSFSIRVFNTSGTYVKPAGLRFVKIIVQGAGGGGGGGSGGWGGGGGGAGGTAIGFYNASVIGSSVAITVGTGGAGGAAGFGVGGTGGASSFGSLISATGGNGGNSLGAAHGANGGTAAGGYLNINGQKGGVRAYSAQGGIGGGSYFSSGGNPYITDGSPSVAGQYGSGASGGTSGAGAAGGNGVVIVEEYF